MTDSITQLVREKAEAYSLTKFPDRKATHSIHVKTTASYGYTAGFTDCLKYMEWRDENYQLVDGDFYHKEDNEGDMRYDNGELLKLYFDTLNNEK